MLYITRLGSLKFSCIEKFTVSCLGGMRKLKNSRKKSVGHELVLIGEIQIEKEQAQIREEFYEQTELEGMYNIDYMSFQVSREILEAFLGRQMWTNGGGPWIQRQALRLLFVGQGSLTFIKEKLMNDFVKSAQHSTWWKVSIQITVSQYQQQWWK